MLFETKKILLDTIDIKDHTFRISSFADPVWIKALADSIDRLGLLQPPLIDESGSHRQIVSGFRRVAACDQLGRREIACRLLTPDAPRPWVAQQAVAENAWQRPLNLMEKARAVALLEKMRGESDRMTVLAALAGQVENQKMIDKLTRLSRLPLSIQRAVENDLLGLAMALALGDLASEDAGQILDLFQTFRFGLNRQRELMELIQEIAKRESISIGQVLKSDVITSILNRPGQDRPARGGALRRYLKQRRYPALSQAETAFKQLESELGLGPRIRLVPPPYFEGNTYQLIFAFDTLDELTRHQQHLEKMRQHPRLQRILGNMPMKQ
ncbi:MAG: hypothetical protein DSY90_09515 [Deltaproteobacteria bacterium]|nr:MAG: hypothetical protein DSY90_09515 [Deltaproteobacteria bacterium]